MKEKEEKKNNGFVMIEARKKEGKRPWIKKENPVNLSNNRLIKKRSNSGIPMNSLTVISPYQDNTYLMFTSKKKSLGHPSSIYPEEGPVASALNECLGHSSSFTHLNIVCVRNVDVQI